MPHDLGKGLEVGLLSDVTMPIQLQNPMGMPNAARELAEKRQIGEQAS